MRIQHGNHMDPATRRAGGHSVFSGHYGDKTQRD